MKKNSKKQKIFNYIAVFNAAEEGGFNVAFPALPGCVTFGHSFEEAQEKAREVLEIWLEELTSRGDILPPSNRRPLVIDEIQVALPAR